MVDPCLLKPTCIFVAQIFQSPPVLPVPPYPNPWDRLKEAHTTATGGCYYRYMLLSTLNKTILPTYWLLFSGGRGTQEERRRPAAAPGGGLGSSRARGRKDDRDGGRGVCEGGGGRRRTRGGRGGGARRVQAEGAEAQGVCRTTARSFLSDFDMPVQ